MIGRSAGVAVGAVALMALVLADGGMFGKGYLVPDVPYQRAVLTHRSGVQEMVIQTTVNAPSGDYSWVVPLPSPPLAIKQPAYDFFMMSMWHFPPKVVLNKVNWLAITAPLYLTTALGLLLLPYANRRSAKARLAWLGGFAAYGALLAVYSILIWSPKEHEATAGAAGALGVEVLSSQQVGAYKVDVIRGPNSNELLQWLARNGTPLPDRAKPIVADYIRKGWCFMAAKVNHKGGEEEAHPLYVKLNSPRPIYPMRLTGLSPTPLLLDMLVISDVSASTPVLDTWVNKRVPEHLLPRDPEEAAELKRIAEKYPPFQSLVWPG